MAIGLITERHCQGGCRQIVADDTSSLTEYRFCLARNDLRRQKFSKPGGEIQAAVQVTLNVPKAPQLGGNFAFCGCMYKSDAGFPERCEMMHREAAVGDGQDTAAACHVERLTGDGDQRFRSAAGVRRKKRGGTIAGPTSGNST